MKPTLPPTIDQPPGLDDPSHDNFHRKTSFVAGCRDCGWQSHIGRTFLKDCEDQCSECGSKNIRYEEAFEADCEGWEVFK